MNLSGVSIFREYAKNVTLNVFVIVHVLEAVAVTSCEDALYIYI